MKVKEVHFSFACTMNMGNYESARCEVGMTATVEEGEAAITALKALRAHIRDIASREMEDYYLNPPTVTARKAAVAKDKNTL